MASKCAENTSKCAENAIPVYLLYSETRKRFDRIENDFDVKKKLWSDEYRERVEILIRISPDKWLAM
jgi:hypothetical protein